MNQPVGFLISQALRPSYYYGQRHDYVYYPESWTDEASGTSYEKGYYDENGQHYDNVAFAKDGKYENVVCSCPYCGQESVLNLDAGEVGVRELQCPHCGGPMEIRSELDNYLSQGTENTHRYASEESLRSFRNKPKKKKRWPWVVAILVALTIYGGTLEDTEEPQTPQIQQVEPLNGSDYQYASNPELFGETLYLSRSGQDTYVFASDSSSADRTLRWDSETESYYDESSDCWIWCNTDMDPVVWQYWYEGISSDYGDNGWMEHYSDGWFIEDSKGDWIQLPERYSTGNLWYIDDSSM